MQLTQTLISFGDRPVVLLALLFLTTFVIEDAAILAAAALAAAGKLDPVFLLASVLIGTILSDWALYFLGAWAGRNARIRNWIGEARIERGRTLMRRGRVAAALTARLIPWLLFPIIVSFGLLGVRFRHFAPINAVFAAVYVNLLFWGSYEFNLVLFKTFAGRGWIWVVACTAAILLINVLVVRRLSPKDDPVDSVSHNP